MKRGELAFSEHSCFKHDDILGIECNAKIGGNNWSKNEKLVYAADATIAHHV